MAISAFGILQTGLSGLRASQTAIAVTSHNIANTNTVGYSRQRVNLSDNISLDSIPGKTGQIGQGVQITSIQRARDVLLDNNYRLQSGQQSNYNTLSANTGLLESVFGPGTNPTIGAGLTAFFNAFHNLATNPENLGTRQAVIQTGVALTQQINNAATQINQIETGIDTSVNQSATDINTMLSQIAQLNKQISYAEGTGQQANDFRDQRDNLVDKLSSYMDLNITEQSTSMIDISVNGEALVTGLLNFDVQVNANGGNPAHLEVQSSNGASLTTVGGKLKGIADSYLSVDTTRTSLDDMAAAIINEVNALSTSGFDLNGNSGLAFFTGTDAATIAVDATVLGDPTKVVAANAASPGNNGIALQMAALADKAVTPTGGPTSTFNQAINNIVVTLGAQTQNATSQAASYQGSVDLVQQQRQATSGVNTDEELSNMMVFQRSYQAAARIITTIDEIMDTLINRTGRVGL